MKEIKTPGDVLRAIEDHFPTGSEKVTIRFLEELEDAARRGLTDIGPRHRRSTIEVLRDLRSHAKRGLTAGVLHHRLKILDVEGPEHQGPLSLEDSAIARLEGQLADLRSMVAEPRNIEHKIRDLQSQVAAIRENIGDVRSTLSEKQEDMLQKFLSAEKRAFIIMPFQRDFENVWLGAIKPACVESHYAPLRVDEVNLSSLITEDIEKYAGMADVVVVDLTGNNANVMFELGWALAKDKKPIVICQGDHTSKVAFDVRGIRHISYENTWLGVEALKKKIKEFISATGKQPSAKKAAKGKKGKSQRGASGDT